jgi:hypothetical protein
MLDFGAVARCSALLQMRVHVLYLTKTAPNENAFTKCWGRKNSYGASAPGSTFSDEAISLRGTNLPLMRNRDDATRCRLS